MTTCQSLRRWAAWRMLCGNCSAVSRSPSTQINPPASMVTTICRPSSGSFGGSSVVGSAIAGPHCSCGATIVKMISSTSTTSTRGVTLMLD
jgi:hypothetical protein